MYNKSIETKTIIRTIPSPLDKSYYRMGQGYCISIRLLEQWLFEGYEYIKIKEEGKKATTYYSSTIEQWLKSPVHNSNGKDDPQHCLPLKQMVIIGSSPPK